MAEENKKSIYREKTLERISNPDQLTDYLKVTNPGIWAILAAVIVLLIGVLVWSRAGVLETRAPATVIVENRVARVATTDMKEIHKGDEFRVNEESYELNSISTDEFGRKAGIAKVDMPDGIYEGIVIVEKTHPLDFLTKSDT